MNFKGMQIVGFKSFADKTTIAFDSGVTCIVGPNGCGKSNVADAVRWVLGEQSAKTLRGSSMQDVIFGGTEKRKSLSFCEVTLTFDNANRMFDIEYDEVSMTRRLFRSGESEYLLNKQPCRLKDIVALLHGVGIGKEGYSIIGQGKVEQIMNAKPEDRRAIFEEATGIMMFKSRKAEIERKLENSRSNLNLFLQTLYEVERQVPEKERQARRTREYNEHYAQLKHLECNAYLYRYENAAGEKAKFQAEIDRINGRIDELNAGIEELAKKAEGNRAKIAGHDTRLSELNAQRLQFSVGLERKSGEAQRVKERAGYFRSQLQLANDDISYAMRRISAIDGEYKTCAANKAKAEKRLVAVRTECEKLSARIRELDARIEVYERTTDESRASVLSSVENLSELKQNIGSLSAQKEAALERIGEVQKLIADCERRREIAQAEFDACLKSESELSAFLADEKQNFDAEYEKQDAVNDKANRAAEEIFSCNAQIASLQENLRFYTGLKDRFDGYKYSVKKLMSDAKTNAEVSARVKGVIADIVKCEKQYEVAVETAFGGAMQNIVTATADDARRLIEYLKQTGAGTVTFLPVQAMRPHFNSVDVKAALREQGAMGLADEIVKYDPYYDNVIRNLLGNTLICDTIYHATAIAKKFRNSFRIVTLDGDIVSTSGAMTGGSKKQDSGNLLANERKIQECEDAIAQRKAYLEKLEAVKVKCDELKVAVAARIESLREKYQGGKTELASLQERQQSLMNSVQELSQQKSEAEGLLKRLQDRLNYIDNEFSTSSEDEETLNSVRSRAAEEMEQQRKDYEAVRVERNERQQSYHDLQVEAAALSSTIDSERTNLSRLESEKAAELKKIEDTRKNVSNIESTIADLDKEAERKALTAEERKQVEDLDREIASLAEQKKVLNAELVLMENSRGEMQSQISDLTERRYRQELEINKAEASLAAMEERISEEYGLDYSGCLELRDENFDGKGAAAQINSLKRKITLLGAVNPAAIEEYDELKERYDGMIEQRDDLEKGIADLTEVLETLKGEMQKQFDAGFNQIRENFKKTYKELFGGGSAELMMDYTDCEDPLNAGVEIMACPPGKKLTKISLLSGGERALTAIAILFAILKMRPMPFCILDEIEAALDEANVGRFAEYLKNFSKDTQFIVITHRKPTMEQADSLFGVTMEEKGVSKIVSVKLSELEERLGGDTVA